MMEMLGDGSGTNGTTARRFAESLSALRAATRLWYHSD